jgi:hypothetical protein
MPHTPSPPRSHRKKRLFLAGGDVGDGESYYYYFRLGWALIERVRGSGRLAYREEETA